MHKSVESMKKSWIFLVLGLIVFVLPIAGQTNRKSQVLAVSKKVIRAVKAHDMNVLAKMVHPTKGLRFSPYGEINHEGPVFTPSEVRGLWKSQKVFLWQKQDEAGRPVESTFAEYYRKWVYDYDFAKPEQINYNTKRQVGIMVNNISEMYPRGVEVEYFIDGTDDRIYGCLRLVYEKLKGKWYLVGVVRDSPGI